MTNAPFIWAPAVAEQRLTVVAFRYEFELSALPGESLFHLFANSHYHLQVNGAQVGYGPARSMPSDPTYDAYDLRSYLQTGKNVIAVLVAHTGGYSFHHMPMPGAFVAWGRCDAHDLSTADTKWRCCVSVGHDANPPRWSFAVPVIEICDERSYPRNWNALGKPAGDWVKPVVIDNSAWGTLVTRDMPALTNKPLAVQEIVQAYTHSDAERMYGFRVVKDFQLKKLAYTKSNTCAYTWIYSEKDQTVTAGTWWGEHYLNGQQLEQQATKPGQCMRTDAELALTAGWNILFIAYGMTQGMWECQVALPSGLRVDANRGEGTEAAAFMVSPTFTAGEFAEKFQGAPQSQEYIAALNFEWRSIAEEAVGVSPERRLAWSIPDQQIAVDEDCPLPLRLPAGKASSVIANFGRIGLGRLCLDVEAPSGTVFDIYYVEELKNGRPEYAKSVVSYTADRRIAAGSGKLEWFFPRGCKYVEIAVVGNDADVVINDIQLIEMRYPYTDDGSFSCSDTRLSTLWEYGVEALRNCSEDVITDCPWRERTMYGGDLLVEMAVGTVHSRDLRLVRRCIDVYLQSQHPEKGGLPGRAPTSPMDNPLGEYQLMIVLAASWYLRLTGDREFIERIMDKLSFIMQQFDQRDPATGLYDYPGNTFIEHTSTQKSGLVCAGNACLAGTYRAYADLLQRFDRADAAAVATKSADSIDAAINKNFWDASKSAYKAGIGQPDAPGNPYQLHASFYPGCFGASTSEIDDVLADAYVQRLREIADNPELRTDNYVGRQDKDFSPYGAFYMLQHLSKMQRADIAEDLIIRFYSVMLRHPTGTIWEQFYSGKSLCHAWSAAPTWYLSTNVLGVQMNFEADSNLDEIVIEPQVDTLEWASGVVPHPLGDVAVSWQINGKRLEMQVEYPAGAEIRVAPRGKLAALDLVLCTQQR